MQASCSCGEAWSNKVKHEDCTNITEKKLNYQTIITPNSNKTKQTLQCNASNVHQLVHVHVWSSKILILIDSRSRRTHHLRRRAIGHPRSRGENMTQSTKYMGSSSSRIQSENPATHSWTMIGSWIWRRCAVQVSRYAMVIPSSPILSPISEKSMHGVPAVCKSAAPCLTTLHRIPCIPHGASLTGHNIDNM